MLDAQLQDQPLDGPLPGREARPHSLSTLTIHRGSGLTVNFLGQAETDPEANNSLRLALESDRPVIVGRCTNPDADIEYLEIGYTSFNLMPGTDESVLLSSPRDIFLSRAHFMLRGRAGGVLFTNGVPYRGGGIRPPLNGTMLLQPEERLLSPAEDLLITPGESITLRLPNDCVVSIQANE